MALNHIPLDSAQTEAMLVKRAVRACVDFRNTLWECRGALKDMIDGDGSQDAHFAPFVANGVGDTNARARSGWSQLDNLYALLNTNASQTAVMDKFNQFMDYFGGN